MDSKIIAVLVGIFVGWLLGQFTELFKEKRERKIKIKAIEVEISNLNDWLIRMSHTMRYMIQLIELEEPIGSMPQKLYPFMLKEYFPQVCMYIPREARIGITDLYASIGTINDTLDHLDEFFVKSDDSSQGFNEIALALYAQVLNTQFKCAFLKENPDGSFEKLNKAASELDSNISKNIIDAKAEATKLGIEKLNDKYL